MWKWSSVFRLLFVSGGTTIDLHSMTWAGETNTWRWQRDPRCGCRTLNSEWDGCKVQGYYTTWWVMKGLSCGICYLQYQGKLDVDNSYKRSLPTAHLPIWVINLLIAKYIFLYNIESAFLPALISIFHAIYVTNMKFKGQWIEWGSFAWLWLTYINHSPHW